MADPTDSSWWFGGATPQNTQYQDRDKILGLINQGYAPGGITNQQAQQGNPNAYAATAPGASQLQMGTDPFRAAQLQQVGQLQQVASGQQQGAGELAAQRQIQQALAAQQATARMARGGNAALAYRNAANQSAALGSTGAGMGQQAAMQDQANAQNALSGAVGQGRGADINVAGQNAGFQQQTGLQNAGFQQQTGLANQQASLQNAQMRGQQQQANAQNYQQLLQQLNGMNANQLQSQAGASQDRGMAGGLLSAGGAVLGSIFSDERLKTDVTDADLEIDDMLDKLTPKSGRYKNDRHGTGEWNWVMAQDLERSTAGKRLVFEATDGKALDVNKVLSTALASTARLNARLRKLEGEQR